MTAWAALTDVQADAVRATAAKLLRDPDELAAEMEPLLADRPTVDNGAPGPPAFVFEGNVVAESVWSLLGTTESGSGLYVRPGRTSEIGVNDPLTSPTLTGVSL